ncbi:hypothetical protein ONS96_001429 [Cadophora gregata f. sp. sojae]|nr:hypothetical protein ONS96_001429 [Cadophora gregata f. sp. sojae]
MLSKLFLLCLLSVATARKHRLCACEDSRGGGTNDNRTREVAIRSNGRFVFSNYQWLASDGCPHPGKYLHAITGEKSWIVDGKTYKASDDGFVGGDEMEKLCQIVGSPHSTCWDGPDLNDGRSYLHCGDGLNGCENTYGSVNGQGDQK